jgi:hypothetical protein
MGKLYTEEEHILKREEEYRLIVKDVCGKINSLNYISAFQFIKEIKSRLTPYINETDDIEFWTKE